MIRVEQSFHLQRVRFRVLSSSLSIMVQVALTCFDLQNVRTTGNLSIYWSGILASFAVGTYNVMFAWKWVWHFQQRVSCIINHDLIMYIVQNFVMVTIHAVLLLLIAFLQWFREATTWNRFQSNWHVELCFKYGGFLSTMGVSMLNVTTSCGSLCTYLMLGPFLMCQLQSCRCPMQRKQQYNQWCGCRLVPLVVVSILLGISGSGDTGADGRVV